MKEYKVVFELFEVNFEEELNRLAKEGWEPASPHTVTMEANPDNEEEPYFWFSVIMAKKAGPTSPENPTSPGRKTFYCNDPYDYLRWL